MAQDDDDDDDDDAASGAGAGELGGEGLPLQLS